jgi:hypothetical protein
MGIARVIGLCPSCRDDVRADEDHVWTCPRDLSPDNSYWEPSDVTEEQMERDQVWSYCDEDHGGWCGDHMPLHGQCYDKGSD